MATMAAAGPALWDVTADTMRPQNSQAKGGLSSTVPGGGSGDAKSDSGFELGRTQRPRWAESRAEKPAGPPRRRGGAPAGFRPKRPGMPGCPPATPGSVGQGAIPRQNPCLPGGPQPGDHGERGAIARLPGPAAAAPEPPDLSWGPRGSTERGLGESRAQGTSPEEKQASGSPPYKRGGVLSCPIPSQFPLTPHPHFLFKGTPLE